MTRSGHLPAPDIEERATSATLMPLIVRGYAALCTNEITEASWAAKTTICRRWGSLAHLADNHQRVNHHRIGTKTHRRPES